MVVMKMTHFEHIPDTCDDCIYNSCRPHPYKGWSESCELCGHCMDDDQKDDWIYDGDSRPKNCPLMEIPTGSEWIPVSERLPDEGYSVLVTRITDDNCKYVRIASYQGDCWMDNTDEFNKPNLHKVIAWKPFSKPYEPQESEE